MPARTRTKEATAPKAHVTVRDSWFNKPKGEYLEQAAIRTLKALRDLEKAKVSLEGAILWVGSSELPMGEFWVQHNIAASGLNGFHGGLNGMLQILLGNMAQPNEFLAEQSPPFQTPETMGPCGWSMAQLRRGSEQHLALPAANAV